MHVGVVRRGGMSVVSGDENQIGPSTPSRFSEGRDRLVASPQVETASAEAPTKNEWDEV